MSSSRASKSVTTAIGSDKAGETVKSDHKRLNSSDATGASPNSGQSVAKSKSKRLRSNRNASTTNQSSVHTRPNPASDAVSSSPRNCSHATVSPSNDSSLTNTAIDPTHKSSRNSMGLSTVGNESIDETGAKNDNGNGNGSINGSGSGSSPSPITNEITPQTTKSLPVTLSSSQNYLSLQEFNSITNSKFEVNRSLLSQNQFLNWSLKSNQLINHEIELYNQLVLNRFLLIKRFTFLNDLITNYGQNLNHIESLLKLKFEKLNNLFNQSLSI